MANYRIDKDSTGKAYARIGTHENGERFYISIVDGGKSASIVIDRHDFLETIRTILEEND